MNIVNMYTLQKQNLYCTSYQIVMVMLILDLLCIVHKAIELSFMKNIIKQIA